MAGTEIVFDAAEFLRRIQAMQRPALDAPVAAALTEIGKASAAQAAALISARNGLNAAAGIFPAVRGLELTISASRAPNPLAAFPHQQTATGVAVNVWGKSQVLRGAFVTSRGIYRRRGSARLPIRQLWGPTIWGTFRTPAVQNQVATYMRNALRERLIARLAAAQRRGA